MWGFNMKEKYVQLKNMFGQNIDDGIYIKLISGDIIKGIITACFNDTVLVIVQKPKGRKNQGIYIQIDKIAFCYRMAIAKK